MRAGAAGAAATAAASRLETTFDLEVLFQFNQEHGSTQHLGKVATRLLPLAHRWLSAPTASALLARLVSSYSPRRLP